MARQGSLIIAGLWLALSLSLAAPASADSMNAGNLPADDDLPFLIEEITHLRQPWALAFLPDGRLLVTEKPGRLLLLDQKGRQQKIEGIPAVYHHGQNGLHHVAPAPDFEHSRLLYLSYVAPMGRGGVLTLMRARLDEAGEVPRLGRAQIIWQQRQPGTGGQPGSIITFSPDGWHLFFTVGDRMQPETAQDPDRSRGKILRMLPNGAVPPDNPQAQADGIRSLVWSTGHRNPYGLAFDANGQLWSHEMGPRGGDELNRIEAGKNYGWPLVSNGSQYSGVPIPDHDTRPDLEAPHLYWTPVIAPAGMVFYQGSLFPEWRGSALIGGLMARGLVRVVFGPDDQVSQANRWSLGARIRDLAVAADGSLWVIEDGAHARLLRLVPAL